MEARSNLATPAAPYTSRAPSPPTIVIPAPPVRTALQPITIVPSFANVDPASLSAADLQIITQNGKEQIAFDSGLKWTYKSRREAQPILDFLYLGPASVARDKQWLRDNGITMLLAARNSWMAEAQLLSADRVAQELGIEAAYVDVSDHQELIRAFPSTVRKINDHMLRVYREQAIPSNGTHLHPVQAVAHPDENSMAIDHEQFRRGKVLVFCETGNDRSASVAVAYLMSVFGLDMINACQFVQYRRFSVSLSDDLKQLLRTYQDILEAQRTVNTFRMNTPLLEAMDAAAKTNSMEMTNDSHHHCGNSHKRGIEDTMDTDDNNGGEDHMVDEFALDAERYQGRQAFVPFVDKPNEMA